MSTPHRGKIPTIKTINFSGWYKVDFYALAPDFVEMKLTVLDRDHYDIVIDLETLTLMIKGCQWGAYGRPADHEWIPKYMIRPTKWGKELFTLNPYITMKLWDLVADPTRMKALKQVPSPFKSVTKLR